MINSKEDFKNLVESVEKQTWYKRPLAFAIARINRSSLNKTKVLEAVYPTINWQENYASAAIFLNALKQSSYEIDTSKSELIFDINDNFLASCIESYRPFYEEKEFHKNLKVISTLASLPIDSGLSPDDFKIVFIFEDKKPKSIESIYLKLYAKHSKKVEKINLEGIEDILTTCAWIDGNPVELEWLRQNEILLKIANKYPKIDYISKYPKFLKHLIPDENSNFDEFLR